MERQGDPCKFKTSLVYTVRPILGKKIFPTLLLHKNPVSAWDNVFKVVYSVTSLKHPFVQVFKCV